MASKRKGLGKGLDALIDGEFEEISVDEEGNGILNVDIDAVEPNREQPRKNFDAVALKELADSIEQFGVIQPLVVLKQDDYYEIVAGERRWRASKLAGLERIPVIIKNFSLQEILEVSLIENIQREDLNPIEEALAYERLIKEFGITQEEVAKKVSKSRSAIANILRLLNLGKRIQQLIIEGKLSSGHSRAILAIQDKNKQFDIARQIIDNNLSVRDTEKLVKKIINPQEKVDKKYIDDLTPIYLDIENNLKEVLGTKVQIKRKNKSAGYIEIDYFSDEDLDRIIELVKTIRNN